MDEFRKYLFSVIITALSCSLFLHIIQNFQSKQIGKVLCGILLSIAVLSPAVNYDKFVPEDFLRFNAYEAEEAVAIGQELSRQTWADIIKLETEAYILDKAADLNADISVAISVDESGDPIPVAVEITGKVTPYEKYRIRKVLEEELGITEENQKWTD